MAHDMTRGLITLDHIEDDIIDVANRFQGDDCRGYDLLNPPRPIDPDFLVLHKAQSSPAAGVTLGSPRGYFTQKCCPALTDLEVNPTTGRMRRFVRRGVKIAGWANGRISSPYGDALAYIEWKRINGGWNPNYANIMGEACEILGWFPSPPVVQDTPVGPEAKAALARWMAARAHDYGIKWEDFPLVTWQANRSYITWHREWTIGTGKTCPGPYVMGITSELIEMARAIMKEAQVGTAIPPDPVYAPLELPEWWSDQLALSRPADQKWDGVTHYVLQRNFRAVDQTVRRSRPDLDADPSGPPVERDTKVFVERQIHNGRLWIQEEAGHYLLASSFTPNVPRIAPR